TRAQMFWLEAGLPNSLAGCKRPRTTLSPTLVLRDGAPCLAFGTPGGDSQDQWSMSLFLRHVHHARNLQEAIESPGFHSTHFPSSFYPRDAHPAELHVEDRFAAGVLSELARRGHRLVVDGSWSLGRSTAVGMGADGFYFAAATQRGLQNYAVGR
ncbi:MAG: gamma-glutamyltransferase, partial [Acidimicrobiales bacterium]